VSITELGTEQLPTPTENNRVKQCNVTFSIYESTIEDAFVKQRDRPPSTYRRLLKNIAILYYVQGLLLWASHHFQVYAGIWGDGAWEQTFIKVLQKFPSVLGGHLIFLNPL
jgi:hypothetical protein